MKGLVAKANGAKHTTEIAASIACGLQSQRRLASPPSTKSADGADATGDGGDGGTQKSGKTQNARG